MLNFIDPDKRVTVYQESLQTSKSHLSLSDFLLKSRIDRALLYTQAQLNPSYWIHSSRTTRSSPVSRSAAAFWPVVSSQAVKGISASRTSSPARWSGRWRTAPGRPFFYVRAAG